MSTSSEPSAPLPSFRKPLLSPRMLALVAAIVLSVTGLVARFWWQSIRMPGRSYEGRLAPLDAHGIEIRDDLRAHVEALASRIGPRSTSHRLGLDEARRYVTEELRSYGYEVAQEEYVADGVHVANVIAERHGGALPREIVIVGAHYDAVGGRPGANDNASGTAVLLEVARAFAHASSSRTLRFVALTNEEPPHYQTESMGSLVNARRARARGDDIVAMISLESLGHYDTHASSQHYPFPANLFYPDRGDFVAFVGRTEEGAFVRRAVSAFRLSERFPSEGSALPAETEGVGWSDHWSYWQVGYPALMLTDTALLRDSTYHTVRDTPEKLDYDGMARVVRGVEGVVRNLASGARPSR